jgi:hypothetical protein
VLLEFIDKKQWSPEGFEQLVDVGLEKLNLAVIWRGHWREETSKEVGV